MSSSGPSETEFEYPSRCPTSPNGISNWSSNSTGKNKDRRRALMTSPKIVAYAEAQGCKDAVLIYPSTRVPRLDERLGDIRVRTPLLPRWEPR